jgi:peptidoglycan-N-acetylglucosamine deacetylase
MPTAIATAPRLKPFLLAVGLAWLTASPVAAADCPGRSDPFGTARVLAVDPATTPPVGRKQYPQTLPLLPKEIVLTFDDGPLPGTTERVLSALASECVHATFFMLGRNAEAHPALARRVLAEGHTVAHHTFSHRLLSRLPLPRAEAEIDHGIAAVETAVYGDIGAAPRTPFFRFPGFAASPALLERLAARRIMVFDADLWASDWNPMSPGQELALLLHRLTAASGGILLLHDTQSKTAAMLPSLLRELKRRGFRVVHVVPKKAKPETVVPKPAEDNPAPPEANGPADSAAKADVPSPD